MYLSITVLLDTSHRKCMTYLSIQYCLALVYSLYFYFTVLVSRSVCVLHYYETYIKLYSTEHFREQICIPSTESLTNAVRSLICSICNIHVFLNATTVTGRQFYYDDQRTLAWSAKTHVRQKYLQTVSRRLLWNKTASPFVLSIVPNLNSINRRLSRSTAPPALLHL